MTVLLLSIAFVILAIFQPISGNFYNITCTMCLGFSLGLEYYALSCVHIGECVCNLKLLALRMQRNCDAYKLICLALTKVKIS